MKPIKRYVSDHIRLNVRAQVCATAASYLVLTPIVVQIQAPLWQAVGVIRNLILNDVKEQVHD